MNHNKQYICLTCVKSLFFIFTYMDLYVSAHVFMWCVVVCWAWLCTWAYVCVTVHLHKHENALSFLWMRKWILANWISVLWDFALGATSWDYAEATSWGPQHRKVPCMVQSVTHSATCHNCRICISLTAKEKVWKWQKEIFMNLFTVFPKDYAYHPFALCINMYVFWYKKN